MKFFLIIFTALTSFLLSRAYLEFDLGFQSPQGALEKYNEPGFSFRGTYTHVDDLFPFIRYDFSIQYLQFKKQTWNEQYDGFDGPLIFDNSEQAFGIFIGPRFMSPTKRGALRPYVGFKVGGMFFNETLKISWQEPDDTFMDCAQGTIISELLDLGYDCNGELNTLSKDYLDMQFDFGALLEIGANINISDKWGADFGVQYNIIPSIRPEFEDISLPQDSPELTEFSKTINVDYVTFYFGINFEVGGK